MTPPPVVSTELPPKYVAPAPGPGAAVAKVDGQPIFAHDVEGLLWESVGPQVVEDFVTLVAVRQAAAKQDIHVTPAEVETRMQADMKIYDLRSKQDQRRPPGMAVDAFLRQEGYPTSRLYLNTEVEVILDKLALKTFKPDSFVKVSMMIFKSTDPTPASAATAEKNATSAVARMKSGASKWNDELAKSQMPADYISKEGLLGWLDQGTFPPDVMQKLKTLKPGQISDPIKATAQGGTTFQVFRVEQLGSKAVGADLDTLRTRYTHDPQLHSRLLSAIRTGAKIERFPIAAPAAVPPSAPTPTPTPTPTHKPAPTKKG
ncbi:MAG: peptidylprolyl isomerase [Fimbriimonadaceae bacterium]